ncbi:hypothetical protein WICMUC_005162 [Wickerhamomyces mucosus]|uniref:Bud emergence protein 1 n=1 Tax=Wickerhamomyces mucosus TaxID=1378264 RepID=A0A9P8PAG3_9ASCO|nr:hypothetical protein WICMUC_005162 [Wickerhamomyces mucosus]
MIKGIRKSLKDRNSKNSISSPIESNGSNTKSVSSAYDIQINPSNVLQSPKKVIKALYDYKPQGPGELEFQKGDFFHVIGNENDSEWYEACNPSKNTRGMVPVPYFEVFGKTRPVTSSNPSSNNSSPQKYLKNTISTDYSSFPSRSNTNVSRTSNRTSTNSSATTLYAIVLYEFKAERSDELDVQIGESIILCAHHNYEWFIAKPIDRLGGPGLVPVSYVSIINIKTGESTGNDIVEDVQKSQLPTVEQWKSKNAKYKASSIPLGDVENQPTRKSLISPNLRKSLRKSISPEFNHEYEIINDPSKTFIIQASVDEFHVDNGRYWFELNCELETGEIRSLCRYYDDFYDFQIKLLELFPDEAGKTNSKDRILPFIPGPLTYVTDKITRKRQIDLNDYIKELLNLPNYISNSNFVKNLFELKNPLDEVIDVNSINLNNNIDEHGYHNNNDNNNIDEDININTNGSTVVTTNDYNTNNNNNNEERTLIKEESMNTITQSIQPTQSTKIKFYYKDDIFALLINSNITYQELLDKISDRIYDDNEGDSNTFKISIKETNELVENDFDIKTVLENKYKVQIDDE